MNKRWKNQFQMELGTKQEQNVSQTSLEGSGLEDGQEKFLCCGDAVSWLKHNRRKVWTKLSVN